MEMKVLGPGCAKCGLLYREAVKAVAQSGQAVSLARVEDIEEIMAYGIMMSPALVIDGRVVSAGRVPGAAEIASMIASAATGARP